MDPENSSNLELPFHESSARGRLAECRSASRWVHGERAARTGDTKTGLQRASACEFHGDKDPGVL